MADPTKDIIDEIVSRENSEGGEEHKEVDKPPEGNNNQFSFEEHFKGFESLDQVKSRLEKFKDLPEDVLPEIPKLNEYKERASKYDELSQQHEQLKTKYNSLNPYESDEDLYKYYEIKKTNPQEAELYKKYVFGSSNPLEVIKADLISKFPELSQSPEMLERKLQRTYPGLYPTKDDEGEVIPIDKTSKDYLDAMDDLTLDASKVKREFINKFDIKLPQKETPESQAAKQAERLSLWKPFLDELKSNPHAVKIDLKDKEDPKKIRTFEIEIPKDILDNHFNLVENYIKGNSIAPDENGKVYINNLLNTLFLSQNKELVAQSIYDTLNTELNKKYSGLVQNDRSYNRQIPDDHETFGEEFDERKTVEEIKKHI